MESQKYTFDNFIVDDGNELAHAVAKAVIDNPGLTYNPVFIYGKTQSGKTHLLQAIKSDVEKLHKQVNVLYTTGKELTMDMISAIRNEKFKDKADFIEHLMRYSVVMIDNIDTHVKKDMVDTQKEYNKIIDDLVAHNIQVIIAFGLAPSYLPITSEHFDDSYEKGIIVDIQAPKKLKP